MRKAYIDSQEEYRVTPANMPRWDLAGEEKIEGVGIIFPQLLCYIPYCVMISAFFTLNINENYCEFDLSV